MPTISPRRPKTARSQLIGGVTMGISMALHEESVMDREFGDYLNHDLAQYHVPVSADIQDIDAAWEAGMTAMEYAGNGQFSFQEDIYNRFETDKVIEEWKAATGGQYK